MISFNLSLPTIMNQLLNGFALGTLLVLMAIGLTIILGLMRVINFTHGVIYALGAYCVVTLFNYTGFWPCLIIGPIVLGLFGMGLEATLIRPLYKRDPLHTMLLTFGLASDDRGPHPDDLGRCRLSHEPSGSCPASLI